MVEALTIVNVFIAGIAVVLGLFLLFGQGRDKQRTLFALLTLTMAVWIVSNYLGSNMINAATHTLIVTDYISGAFLGLQFWLFSREMRENVSGSRHSATNRSLATMTAFVVTITVVIMILAGLIVTIRVDSALEISNGPLYLAYPLCIVILVLFGINHLVRAQLKSHGSVQKTRLRLILAGLLIAFILVAVPNLVFENIFPSDSDFLVVSYNSSYAGILAFLLISTYAMVRHSLFDIKFAAMRSAVYVLVLLTLSAIYYSLAYLASITLFQGQNASALSTSPINIGLALVLAFLFQPVKIFFDKVTNDIFYKDRYDASDFYARLSEVLITTTDLRNLLERAAHEIGTTLKAEQAFLFVQYADHHLSAGTARHASLPLKDANQIGEYSRKTNNDVIITGTLPEDHPAHRLLTSYRIAILLPLVRGSVILGYLALGEQRSGGYTNRDVKVLKTISDELVIAIQNALSVQEVQDINKHLQQRIESATAELRTSNTQLRHLDKTKDEFLSMASHQLRTPLTSVKGYLSMVLEGDAGKVTDTQKQLLGEAFTSSERMVHLIHDFLNVSRLQTGKFMLEQHPYDIAKLVAEEVKSLQRAAETRNMKLEFTNTIGELVLNIDENKIRQVIMNFIDNALFYSHDDSVIKVELTKADDNIELRVKDTGIGVPKGEQSQLFTKFYRASNARKQRPDGTGVGIFLAKKVITEHGGEVLFESTEGKGSTFGFTLPIEKLKVDLEKKSEQPKE